MLKRDEFKKKLRVWNNKVFEEHVGEGKLHGAWREDFESISSHGNYRLWIYMLSSAANCHEVNMDYIKKNKEQLAKRGISVYREGEESGVTLITRSIINDLDKFYKAVRSGDILDRDKLYGPLAEMQIHHPLYVLRDELDEKACRMYEHALYLVHYENWKKIDEILTSTDSHKYVKAVKLFKEIKKDVFGLEFLASCYEAEFDAYAEKMWEFYM